MISAGYLVFCSAEHEIMLVDCNTDWEPFLTYSQNHKLSCRAKYFPMCCKSRKDYKEAYVGTEYCSV